MKQLTLFFPNIPTYKADEYVVSNCNADAHNWLSSYPKAWTQTVGSIILGDRLSGKTHLSHTFLSNNPGVRLLNGHVCSANHPFDLKENLFVLDDADHAPAPWLFHFFNHIKERNAKFVLTMTRPYQDWCTLKDLSSRLSTLPVYYLNLPDDTMMLALLRKNFADRGVLVDESVLSYLAQYIDRSYQTAHECVQEIERLAAEHKRAITLPFVRQHYLMAG